jgi:hypothetical protein
LKKLTIQGFNEGIWENISLFQYGYDTEGNNTLFDQYQWIDASWTNTGKLTKEYDENSNITFRNSTYWDFNAENWLTYAQDVFEYDEDADIVYSEERFNFTTDDNYSANRTFFYYQSPTSHKDLSNEYIKLYPNPAMSYFILDVGNKTPSQLTMRIYTANGQIMLTTFFRNNANRLKIPLDKLSPGYYFVELSGEEFLYRQPLIIVQD